MLSLIRVSCVWALCFASACSATTAPGATETVAASAVAPFASFEIMENDQTGDATLAAIRRSDRASRTADGKLVALPADELTRRASVFAANRLFPEAREYWLAFLDKYPNHPNASAALFGIGRTFYQERQFTQALTFFERGAQPAYLTTKEGRDCFYYLAPTLLRLNKASEAARGYEQYAEKFPQGERVESAYLNAIDTWREADKPDNAARVITRTRERFRNTATATNALFARLRLEISQGKWTPAVLTCDELLRSNLSKEVSTTRNEIFYLRAFSLEKDGKKDAAVQAYAAVPDDLNSYYGGLATERLDKLGDTGRKLSDARQTRVRLAAMNATGQYPTAFRDEILRSVRGRAVDPRLMLAVMRQESGFRPNLKSPAAARGLMQLTIDTATKYAPAVGVEAVTEDVLYRPATNLLLAAEYLAQLGKMFDNLPEAVAASYNGGEDNAIRWQRRATHDDAGVFASEVGFAETKDYVLKVMANYRVYRTLYTNNLRPQN